ncbi:tumor necrosis factor ligand superfamily member 11-like [Haliotis rufescens]|uniref:tumor necrosis factor ligand superfamily member 11-like n=1 Tax=Haliotis rufescens TaxID=6454 RepID=UPI00201EA46F|nr:tumor necrosis factor ligand superfamily member 11-like [Haliotis rufescens]
MYMNIVVGEYYHDLNGDNRGGDLPINHDRPAAHLYLDTNSVTDQNLQWNSSAGYGTAHVTGDVTYSNGRLHVPRDGMYYIYSFLTIRSDVVTNDDLNIVHSVQKYNSDHIDTDRHLLLMGKTSLKERHGQFTNSFLAANLKLKKNDELFVSLSNTSLVYTFPPANYFGVHML